MLKLISEYLSRFHCFESETLSLTWHAFSRECVFVRLYMQQLLGEGLHRLQIFQIFLYKVKRWEIMTTDTSIVDVLDAVDYNLFDCQLILFVSLPSP